MPDDEEESTGTDFKYHLITLSYIIIAFIAVFIFGYMQSNTDYGKLGELTATTWVGIMVFRYLV